MLCQWKVIFSTRFQQLSWFKTWSIPTALHVCNILFIIQYLSDRESKDLLCFYSRNRVTVTKYIAAMKALLEMTAKIVLAHRIYKEMQFFFFTWKPWDTAATILLGNIDKSTLKYTYLKWKYYTHGLSSALCVYTNFPFERTVMQSTTDPCVIRMYSIHMVG